MFAPELKQIAGVEFALFLLQTFLLVSLALPRGQAFQHFPFPIGALIFHRHPLPRNLEPLEFCLKVLPPLERRRARRQRKLEFRCTPSRSERGVVRPRRLGERLVDLRNRFLGSRNRKTGFPQALRPLPLKALPQPQQRS